MRKTVEITQTPFLESGQSQILDFHSVLNALQALGGELFLLEREAPLAREPLRDVRTRVDDLIDRFGRYPSPQELLRAVAKAVGSLGQTLESVHARCGELPAEARRSCDVLEVIRDLICVRVGELFDQTSAAGEWRSIPIVALEAKIRDFFGGLAEFSRGRFGIVFDPEAKSPYDYLVDLDIRSAFGTDLRVPPSFLNLLCDLSANARKYSAPGSTININVRQDHAHLRVSVEDCGIGIPVEEIERVVQFGVRGSNVGPVRTLGGGFGLTKAVCHVKGWGGRFVISSGQDAGMRVWFEVPVPASSAAPGERCVAISA